MKRLVLCFDGTWEARPSHRRRRKGHNATNVEKTHIAVEKEDGNHNLQITWYHRGIGSAAVKYWPGLTGHGISATICDAYAFIADNFELSNDELFIFGFSRGAYTARSLCGFMKWVGVLKKRNLVDLAEAYEQYRLPEPKRDDRFRGDQMQSLKEREPDSFPVRFLGVWDTVGSVGLPVPLLGPLINRGRSDFHDVELSPNVQYAFQALAIHERRGPFRPEIWLSKQPGQTVAQAWFAGTHADVGGGNRDVGLSGIALHWMICQAEHLGLAFDRNYLQTTTPDAACKVFNSSSGVWRAVLRHIRKFGTGVNECYHESVPIHVAHVANAKRPKKWRKAEGLAMRLSLCAGCKSTTLSSMDTGSHLTQNESDIVSERAAEKRREMIEKYPPIKLPKK